MRKVDVAENHTMRSNYQFNRLFSDQLNFMRQLDIRICEIELCGAFFVQHTQ